MTVQPEVKTCPKHNKPLKWSEEQQLEYCPDCLYSSFLTAQAQSAAVNRYNKTEKHKVSEKKYEQGTGKEARDRYLSSDKYKARRKEYNQRLAESLRIARAVHHEKLDSETAKIAHFNEALAMLTEDIRAYIFKQSKHPTPHTVIQWADNEHKLVLTPEQAQALIDDVKENK